LPVGSIKKNRLHLAGRAQVIRLAPGNAGAYHLRGLCYANLGDNDKAITDFVAVARLNRKLLTPTSEPEWLLSLFAKAQKVLEESKAQGDSEGGHAPRAG
jgi:tetratricopeptide (TPR) repeat protein